MRQYSCIELSFDDVLRVSDCVPVLPAASSSVFERLSDKFLSLAKKLAEAAVQMERERLKTINVLIDEDEALILLQYVSEEAWDSSRSIRQQVRYVLHERNFGPSSATADAIERTFQDISKAFEEHHRS